MTSVAAFPDDDLLAAQRVELARRHPALAQADRFAPPLKWRRREPGFAALLWLITGQQISAAAAAAVWARIGVALDPICPHSIRHLGSEDLRALGLTRGKAVSALRLANLLADHPGRLEDMESLSDAEATARLVALPGIGRWSAEIYLMSCLGRVDVFPAADSALREALRWSDQFGARPDEHQTRARARAFSPLRSVAAHLLWAWYGAVRAGAAPPPELPGPTAEFPIVMEPS